MIESKKTDDIIVKNVRGIWGTGYSLYNCRHGQWLTKPIKVTTEKEAKEWLNRIKEKSNE